MESFTLCSLCSKRYQVGEREPQVLFCCGSTACQPCIDLMKEKLGQADSTGTFGGDNNFKFDCKFCHSSTFSGSKLNTYARDYVVKELKEKPLMITCDQHPTKPVEYFCSLHQKLLCHHCVVSDAHSDHLVNISNF